MAGTFSGFMKQNVAPCAAAKSYVGLYDGTNYINTSGMTAGTSNQSTFGVQINPSSRFETNGSRYPITLTYTNLRFKRESNIVWQN